MISGINKNVSEKAYREVGLDSSSSLKDFALDRKKYFRKYILGEDVEDKDSQAALMGRIVETLLMEPELFDTRFAMSAVAKSPTGKMLDFVEALYDFTILATSDEGDLTRSFEDIAKDAYVKSGYSISLERVLKSFEGDNEIYYNEILEVRTKGLSVVTAQDVTNAENIVQELKTNVVTRDLVNMETMSRFTVINQHQVEGYTVDGHLFKSMKDKTIMDHQRKTVQTYDLKCVWAVENFYEEYYLYRRAYIQAYLYYVADLYLTTLKDGGCYGYTVLPPKFIVCDSTNYYNPLIYTLGQKDINDAYNGFEHKGRKYPGVKELIEDLRWALETNTWNISRKNSLTNGIVRLVE